MSTGSGSASRSSRTSFDTRRGSSRLSSKGGRARRAATSSSVTVSSPRARDAANATPRRFATPARRTPLARRRVISRNAPPTTPVPTSSTCGRFAQGSRDTADLLTEDGLLARAHDGEDAREIFADVRLVLDAAREAHETVRDAGRRALGGGE